MRRMIQADQRKRDFARGIMSKYGIARWRSRLHALVFRKNPTLFGEPSATEKPRETGVRAGSVIHAHYQSNVTRLVTQQSAPVYVTNRIVRINRINPVPITHRSSMVPIPQTRREEGNKYGSLDAGSSVAPVGRPVQAEGAGLSAAGQSMPVMQDAEKHEPRWIVRRSSLTFPGRGQMAEDAILPIRPAGPMPLREQQLLQPLHLIHHQMRIPQTFRYGNGMQDISLKQPQSTALRAYTQGIQPSSAETSSAISSSAQTSSASPNGRQAVKQGTDDIKASGTIKSAPFQHQPSVESGNPPAARQPVPLKLALGKGLARMLAGAEKTYETSTPITTVLHRSYPDGTVKLNGAGEPRADGAGQSPDPQAAAVSRYSHHKRTGRNGFGYTNIQQPAMPALQDVEAEGRGSMFNPVHQIQYVSRKRVKEHQTAAAAMILRDGRSRGAMPVMQEPLPLQPMDSSLVHRRPEKSYMQRESSRASGLANTQDHTVTYSAAAPATHHQASNQKTVMGADEIHLVAERVFQVLEKRLNIHKDRRGLR